MTAEEGNGEEFLRSHPDVVVASKDSEINSGNLENLYDDWEFKENEIMHAQNKLRSTWEKLAVLEGKMAMDIIDSQRIVREKQRKYIMLAELYGYSGLQPPYRLTQPQKFC